MRSIKWCHFQRPWTTPNLVFKVTPFFDTEYLTNGYRHGHSYYRRRIGNVHPRFQMALISMTLSDLWPTLQGHDNIQRPITRLIVSRVWSVQWFRFPWPSVTLKVDFKVTEMPSTNCAQPTSDLFAIAKFLFYQLRGFCRAMLCTSAAYAVMWCPSVSVPDVYSRRTIFPPRSLEIIPQNCHRLSTTDQPVSKSIDKVH